MDAVTTQKKVVNLMSDAASADGVRDRRWVILGVIGLAQLMVILDLTVMNIALPSAQRALHFTTVDRQWVVTAYTLAFGSLLLLGGRTTSTTTRHGSVWHPYGRGGAGVVPSSGAATHRVAAVPGAPVGERLRAVGAAHPQPGFRTVPIPDH